MKHPAKLVLLCAMLAGPCSALALAGDGEPRRIAAIPSDLAGKPNDADRKLYIGVIVP